MELLQMTIASLKEQRANKVDSLKAILAKAETERRDLNENEQSAFDNTKVDLEKLDKDIRNAEFVAEYERRMAGEPVATNGDKHFDIECREFSLRKAIAAGCPGINVDCGREREVSQELERRYGVKAEGIMVPTTVFEKRVVTTGLPSGGPGGTIISMDYRPDMFIDRLREALVIQRMGARVLNGLVGNVGIPSLTASATGAWVAENSALSASDPQFGMVTMTPKHVGALTEISRNMILQSSPDIEDILRADFAALIARAIDSAAIKGGGANEPVGVLSAAGVTEVPGGTNGLAPSYVNVLALVSTLANANVAGTGFITNSKTVGKLATVLKSTADTSSNFILESPGAGALAGFPLGVSNLVPSNLVKGSSGAVCSALIFGAWSDLLLGYWSAFDLLVNPYESTAYTKGNIQVRAMATADVQLRHVESFAKTSDILTT
jgi:HK97 family phage major capsid protein